MSKLSSMEKEEFWRLAVAEHERSGSSVREFCRREGLSEPSFYAWRSKLRVRQTGGDRDWQQKSGVAGLVPVNVVQSPKATSPVFHMPQSALAGVNESVEIATPGGFVLRVREAIEDRCLSNAT